MEYLIRIQRGQHLKARCIAIIAASPKAAFGLLVRHYGGRARGGDIRPYAIHDGREWKKVETVTGTAGGSAFGFPNSAKFAMTEWEIGHPLKSVSEMEIERPAWAGHPEELA